MELSALVYGDSDGQTKNDEMAAFTLLRQHLYDIFKTSFRHVCCLGSLRAAILVSFVSIKIPMHQRIKFHFSVYGISF